MFTYNYKLPNGELVQGGYSQVRVRAPMYETSSHTCLIDKCMPAACVQHLNNIFTKPASHHHHNTRTDKAVVVDEAYTLHIPENLDLAAAAPLLCAGITVWSPFVHYGVRSHHAVGVVGLGGLGASLFGSRGRVCACVMCK